MYSRILLFALLTSCLAAGPTSSSTQPAAAPRLVQLTVHPQATTQPALLYELVPGFRDQAPGDAAPIYLMAFLQMKLTPEQKARMDEWLNTPVDKLPLADAESLLAVQSRVVSELERAVRQEHCNWQLPYREQGFATLMPHLTLLRDAGRTLALKARVQISQGHFDEAIHTLQTGFGLTRHLKNESVVIQGLIAEAINELLLNQLADMQQMRGAPNLYFAYANLPRPLVDLRAMLDLERSLLWLQLPELKGRRVSDLSADQLQSVYARFEAMFALAGVQQDQGVGRKLANLAMVVRLQGTARAWLMSHGYAEKKLAEMPGDAVVLAYLLESYQHDSDNIYKWSAMPYWQARKNLAIAEEALKRQDGNPLTQLLPAASRISFQVAKIERRVVMLQTVEALRAYAATHDGKLPTTLDAMTETPAPLDPMTGKSLEYSVNGSSATLRSVGDRPEESVEFKIELAR